MDKTKVMKVVGIVLPIASAGLALVSSFVEDKKLDDKVAEHVAKALENQSK